MSKFIISLQPTVGEVAKGFRNPLLLGLSSLIVLGLALMVISCVPQPLTSEPTRPSPTERSAAPPEEVMTLDNYPKLFEKKGMIVVGENATQIEREASEAIAKRLEGLTGNKPAIRREDELLESEKGDYNLILVGTPKSNSLLQEICELTNATRLTEKYPGKNKGVLEILANPWNSNKALLIVAGSDEWGVKAGSEKLTGAEAKELSGQTMVTEFAQGQEINREVITRLNTVMDYIKRNHPDAAAFIKGDMSWIRSDVDIRPGYSRNIYTSGVWSVTIGYAITPERVYEVRAEYDEKIVWKGTMKEGVISDRGYMRK